MKIEFYEEFPNKENLEKLRFINFPTKIFIAAKSVKEFKECEKIAKSYKKDLEAAYWPIIPNSYWISLFSNTSDLIKTFRELEKINNCILIDLEMPINKKMILKNFFCFFKNKKIIKKFMEKNKKRITTAQPVETIFSKYLQIRGQDFNIKTEKSFMWYSSMLPDKINKIVKRKLSLVKDKQNYSISLGTIAHGVQGDESILSSGDLEKDLSFVKSCGFKKVIIFRLGGLNNNYIKVIEKFI